MRRRTDARHAGLHSFRRARRRLGRLHRFTPRLRPSRNDDWHPSQPFGGGQARSAGCWQRNTRGEGFLDELAQWLREETGYQWIQGTRPQTLAFGLTDSPAGLAAWIVEKFRAWSDCAGDVEISFTRDRLLANISLYWFTGAIGSSFWPYYARMHGPWPIPAGRTIDVPTGYAQFPREIIRPPRSLAARTYGDIRRWSVMPRGGHFAALEQPEALANEVRDLSAAAAGITIRTLRSPSTASTARKLRFACDSLLEGDGFELSSPRVNGQGDLGRRGQQRSRFSRWRCNGAPCPSRARETDQRA